MYVTLIQNAALLVALSTLYGLLARVRRAGAVLWIQLLSGLLFGGVSIAAMVLPYHYEPGIIYDGRSITLAVAGLFGGTKGSAVAVLVAGVYRALLGGVGVWAGLATIVVCPLVGLAFRRHYKDRPESMGVLPLYGLGLASHAAMLACQLLLPWERALSTIRAVWIPVVVIFPLATMVVGLLLRTEERRVQTARELAESNDQFNRLADGLDALVWTASADGRTIRDVNQVVERLYGLSPEEVRADARAWLERVHPDDREGVEAKIGRVYETGQAEAGYRIVKPDGEVRWVRDQRSMIYDARGRVTGMGGIVTDITENAAMERERESLRAQVLQSQKMEAVGRLAGGVAHDFNNLLTVINSYAELAIAQIRVGDRLREDVQQILAAGQRAAKLTRQLLAFSRRQVLEPEILNLSQVVAETEKMLSRLIGEDIEIRTHLAQGLWSVRADPAQVQQVIMNLVVNARDAMPQGGVVTIQTANSEFDADAVAKHPGLEPGQYVMLAVSDTGCGMDEATRERIFEPFFTTKEQGSGTGLGLSMVYGIVTQSGGHILVHSVLGEETTFTVYLPRVGEDAVQARVSSSDRDRGGSETILLAEDDQAVRELAGRILTGAGYKVLPARGGEQALLLAQAYGGEIHLLLTDVVMPGLSGREVADRLGQSHPEIKTLYMSGYTDDAIIRHGVLEDEINLVAKPFSQEQLLRRVRQALDGKE